MRFAHGAAAHWASLGLVPRRVRRQLERDVLAKVTDRRVKASATFGGPEALLRPGSRLPCGIESVARRQPIRRSDPALPDGRLHAERLEHPTSDELAKRRMRGAPERDAEETEAEV